LPNLVLTCPTCGQKISPSIGECLYCPPPVEAGRPSRSPNPFSPHPVEDPAASADPTAAAAAPTAAQLLLVAEECLVRAQPDKAADLAGRALHLRPDSLEAKALLDRARRLLARQRRRGREEERLKEAERLLEAGELAGAETVVGSVLQRMPGHPEALALFGRIKGRRLAKGDAEAEAEQELSRLSQGQARRAAESARTARDAGWDRKAMLALRRGLRLVPDDPDLIGLWQETQRSLGEQDRAGSRRRAGNAQVRAALDLMKEGRLDESLEALRSLLRQDPDHARAQAAIQ
jgi:tetratricopeptide (TPR) repeat protein